MSLPPAMRGKKRDAIMQLKGYLMLFDQILSNYFAQLEHFSELFSLKPDTTRTYFGGTIDALRWHPQHGDTPGPQTAEPVFRERLRAIAHRSLATIDNFDDRRNRFLDHLSARFGERLGHYGISRFNTYHTPEAFKKQLIDIKTTLLEHAREAEQKPLALVQLRQAYWGTTNISFMEWKLKILLGLSTKGYTPGRPQP